MYSSSGTFYYYVMDIGASKVFILNEQWSFISARVFCYTSWKMISFGISLYMTGDYNVWKLYKDLNILKQPHPLLILLVLIQKTDLVKFQRNKSVFEHY